jgi:hypothetical protein
MTVDRRQKVATGAPRFLARHAFEVVAILLAAGLAGCDATPLGGSSYQREFGMAQCPLVSTGRNPYFVLEPGYQVVLEGGGVKLETTVLDETKSVEGVTTRVVEEREWKDGKLSEIARNYFAFCERTKDVFYFGEDVFFYTDDKVTGHEGTWLAGRGGAKPGLIMPGAPRVGMKYFQEIAPSVAMDRAEIVSVTDACKAPAGSFSNCLKTRELAAADFWSSLRFWEVEYKIYAPGIGLVEDQEMRLTQHGFVKK